jgi:PIN domain nuclease of toxin-antitoxin system
LGELEVILLDTHVLVWAAGDAKRLSRRAEREIRKAQGGEGCAIASVTLWELAWLFEKGRLRGLGTIEASIREIVADARATVLEITPEIAALSTMFPESYPKDPADRLIGATARALGLTLITRNERILRSPLVRSIW